MFTQWKPDLLMAVPLTLALIVYGMGARRTYVPRLEIAAFLLGWLVLVIALLSPIATFSEALFSVHMTQHELLMLVAAPLLTLGRPLVPMIWALPMRWRFALKGGAGMTPAWSHLTAPVVVFVLHALALWVWHVPALYQAAVLDDRVHALQHLMFTGTACLFWWGLTRGRYGRLGYGAAVFYVFATAMHSGALGALITFASAPLYPLYVHRAGHGVDPLGDQQLAGLIMWIPAGVVLTIFGLALLSAWLGEAERRAKLMTAIFVALCCAPLMAQRNITIRVDESSGSRDYADGIALGRRETERAAMLLGRRLQFVTNAPAAAHITAVAPAHSEGAVVAMRGESTGRCVFVTQSPKDSAIAHAHARSSGAANWVITDWHAAFRRYGASELNERFEQTFGRPMTGEAWHGWVAVKAVVEAALRGDDICAELSQLRFDGHKGRALGFDPETRHLRHPVLIVTRVDAKDVVEVVP